MSTSNNSAPIVAIKCMTFNHGAYIREALEGFVAQKTEFPFVVIVHDDASTDETPQIIMEYASRYPNIIRPILQTENQYSKRDGSISRILMKAIEDSGAKFVAFCEGDDYWVDPYKLQRQVDIMETNPNIGLTYSRATKYYQVTGIYGETFGGSATSFDDLLKGNKIPTCTVMIRTDVYNSFYKIWPDTSTYLLGDYQLWLHAAATSTIHFDNKSVAVYRILKFSASHTPNYQQHLAFSADIQRVRISAYKRYGISSAQNVKTFRESELSLAELELRVAIISGKSHKDLLKYLWSVFLKSGISFKDRLRAIPMLLCPVYTTNKLKKRFEEDI